MNRRTKFALFMLPLVVLSVALLVAKWKSDNPTPTKLDLEVRARFLRTKSALFNLGLSTSPFYLSRKEREDVSKHLWISSKIPIGTFTLRPHFIIRWETPSKAELINIGSSTQDDVYQDLFGGGAYKIHPATSRYLRQWLDNHPEVRKQLHLK
jgi:hypothetical protein